MKIHNRGKFHLYSTCGCQVINFKMFSWQCSIREIALYGVSLSPNSHKCCQILPKFLPELVFKNFGKIQIRDNFEQLEIALPVP